MNPSVGWIERTNRFVDGMKPLPFGRRIAAVDRQRVVKLGIAFRYEIAVVIGDITFGIRIDGIV